MKKPVRTLRPAHPFADLCDLMIKHFPEHKTDGGAFNVQGFAAQLGYASETVYKALRETQPLKMGVAHRVILLSHTNRGANPLYWADLVGYILPDYYEYARAEADTDLDTLLD